jgi:hypothetical protein
VRSKEELGELRETLKATHEKARAAIVAIAEHPRLLERLKFERLGCDPLDPSDPQNLAEQIDQQATYEAAVDALDYLWQRHPGHEWLLAPGAHGSGHDLQSTDGTVAAEVFAAVKPTNNQKLAKDLDKIAAFSGPHRYVFYLSPGHPRGERQVGKVTVVSLGIRIAD